MRKRVYPSIYSSNPLFLRDELAKVDRAGFETLHVDIQDGVFVPDISFGMKVVEGLRAHTDMLFNVHLMLSNPEHYIPRLAKLGKIRSVLFHPRTVLYPGMLITDINRMGAEAGFALTPLEDIAELEYYKGKITSFLVCTGEPDNAGGRFDPNSLRKIERIREMFGETVDIVVDGDINAGNLLSVAAAGASRFVMGRELFAAPDFEARLRELEEVFRDLPCGDTKNTTTNID